LQKSDAQWLLFVPKIGKTAQLDEIYEVFPRLNETLPENIVIMGDLRVPQLIGVVHTAKKHLNGMVPHIDAQAAHYYEELIRPGQSITADEVSSLILDGPEFAAFSQSNLINTANSLGAAIGLTDSTASLNCLLPTTAAGITAGFMLPIVRRSKMVVPYDVPAADVSRIHESISQHGVSSVIGDATVWNAILTGSQPAQTKAFVEKIKHGLIVGDNKAVDSELVKAIQKTLGVSNIHVTNGSTNTSGVALVNGQPLANTEVKLVDKNGKDSTSSGFLAVKGVNVFKGYYNAGSLDASSIKSGWVTTNIQAEQSAANTFKVSN
jgi:hypothetical protein